jgi:hypothetical protein
MDLADRTVMLLGGSGLVGHAVARRALALSQAPQNSGRDVEWNAIEPADPIEPSRFATWVLTVEDKGTRITR